MPAPALTLPSAREEAWRWSDLTGLAGLAAAAARGGSVAADHLWLGCGGPRLLFVDGVYVAEASDAGPVRLTRIHHGSSHALAAQAQGAGWALELGEGHAPAAPIEIVHVGTGAASHVPARIALATDAQAAIVETFAGEGWANRATVIALGERARLTHAVRFLQDDGFQSLRIEAEVADDASLVVTALGGGGGATRFDVAATLAGEGAFADVGGALLARGEQKHDAAVVLRHAAPHGTSRQTWRAVADDRATASMAARIEVARGAQKTDGGQSLKGLLLTRGATVNLKPELEIFADDVKCAHGATVGELDRQALFYLESRGIPPLPARALLTRAFVADAFGGIGTEAVRAAFEADAEAWLVRAGQEEQA